MIRDKEIQELQNEIANLRRKESEAHQALMHANETIKTSTEISAVERAWALHKIISRSQSGVGLIRRLPFQREFQLLTRAYCLHFEDVLNHFSVPLRQMCLTMDSMSIFIVKHICRKGTEKLAHFSSESIYSAFFSTGRVVFAAR